MKLALYSEYIGSQRRAEDRRLVAVAETEEEINASGFWLPVIIGPWLLCSDGCGGWFPSVEPVGPCR